MQLVEEAASNKAGLMTSTDDDFLFCKTTVKSSGSDDYVYGTGNGILSPSASRSVMNFMLGAKDPRVRFIYTKNSFNSSVVQAFIDKGRYDDLPSEVKANVIRDKDGNFEKWGGMGEPWVRYTSVPIVLDAKASHAAGKLSDEMYEEYFIPGLRYEIMLDVDHKKDYSPFSYYSTEMRKGRDDFQLPTAMTQSANGKIDMNVLQDTEDNPLYSMYMTAGEVNLYLAELACLKGSKPLVVRLIRSGITLACAPLLRSTTSLLSRTRFLTTTMRAILASTLTTSLRRPSHCKRVRLTPCSRPTTLS